MEELRKKLNGILFDNTTTIENEDVIDNADAIVDQTIDLIEQSNRALIERIRSELPSKMRIETKYNGLGIKVPPFQIYPEKHDDDIYKGGFNSALDDVNAVLTAIEGEMK